MDLTVTRVEANEIAKSTDFQYGNEQAYENLNIILEEFLGHTTNDLIVAGLVCQQRGTPSMNVDLTVGIAYCKSTGKLAHTGSLFGPISISSGGAQDRIDTLEVRLLETDYDQQQRAIKNPVTGSITYQDVYTKTRYELEAQIIAGTEGAGVAPSHTSGWVKVAEIDVDAGESTSILNADIHNCSGGYDTETTSGWTTETAITFRLKTAEEVKALFRTEHDEDGGHTDDIIKDNHIDWGAGAGQVSAADVPIVDAGGLITATEIEAALQELAGAGRTTETIGDSIQDSANIIKNTHIDWGSGAGQVDMDDIPDSTTREALTTTTQTISGLKDFDDGFVVENRISDPGSPVTGQMWFRTDL